MYKHYKSNKYLRTVLLVIIAVLILTTLFKTQVTASSVYEYYFIPDTSEADGGMITNEYSEFIDSLPSEIKEKLPDEIIEGDSDTIVSESNKLADFRYIWNELLSALEDLLFPTLGSVALVLGILLISAMIRSFKNNTAGTSGKLTDYVLNLGVIMSIAGTELVSIEYAERFKTLISGLMNGMVPVFAVVYTASGNVNTAAIQSGGVMLLVTLCQNLFSLILLPSVRICLLLSIVCAVFPDIGLGTVTTVFRNISNGIMMISVTLFSFVLGLQNTVAQSADSFGARSIKFAVGNLVPIIGGAVSDSLGTIGGSLSVLKNAGGTVAIIIIILLLFPTLGGLLMRRFSLYICKSIAGAIGCKSEEKLLSDLGCVSSMMLAFSVAISIAFIYMLTLFTGSALAITE